MCTDENRDCWASEELVETHPHNGLVVANDDEQYNGAYGEYLWYLYDPEE